MTETDIGMSEKALSEDETVIDMSPRGNMESGIQVKKVMDEEKAGKMVIDAARRLLKHRRHEKYKKILADHVRSFIGEFSATFIFITLILGSVANGYQSQWNSGISTLNTAVVAGFTAVVIVLCFSKMSGAVFNPAITIALVVFGKLGPLKGLYYILTQLGASMAATGVIFITFPDVTKDLDTVLSVFPPPNASHETLYRIFGTEVFLTACLTYIAFTMAYEGASPDERKKDAWKETRDHALEKKFGQHAGATQQTVGERFTRVVNHVKSPPEKQFKNYAKFDSSPKSETGFAPFAIGYTIFVLAIYGGASGGAFNPARIFGPAVYSGNWDYCYVYYLGEVAGALVGAFLSYEVSLVNDTAGRKGVSYLFAKAAAPVTSRIGGRIRRFTSE